MNDTKVQELGWELIRSFLGVLTEGSLSAAARQLGLAQPTIGRHVAALEAHLQTPLFVRSPSGLLPTEVAQRLAPHARAMAHSAAAMQRAVPQAEQLVSGSVRITASQIVGAERLPTLLAALHAAHPALKLELSLSNTVADLLLREADIAVRMTEPTQDALIARRVPDIALGLFAHRDYLARRGMPDAMDALWAHSLVGYDQETPFLRTARAQFPAWQRSAFSFRSDSDLAQLAMIRAGCGIGFCQTQIARRDPALVPILAPEVSLSLPTWVTMHEDLRQQPACRVVFDALIRAFDSAD